MQSKPKVNSVVTHTLDEETNILTFTVRGVGSFPFDPMKAHENVQNRAAIHGFVQRIADGAALSRDTTTGQPASALDKFNAMKRIAEHYETGVDQWRLTAGDGAAREGSIVLRALAAIQGGSVADAERRVRDLAERKRATTRSVLAKLREYPDVKRKIAELLAEEAERAEPIEGMEELFAIEGAVDGSNEGRGAGVKGDGAEEPAKIEETEDAE